MIILLKMLLAHTIGDFLLQPHSWVKDKEAKKLKSLKLYLHFLVHGILLFILLWSKHYALFVGIYTLLHAIVDIFKLKFQKPNTKPQWFIADQLLHLLCIIVLWYIWEHPVFDFISIGQNPVFWLYALAILFLTVASGIIIQMLLTNWSKQIQDEGNDSLKKAGQYIGILERLFVFVFVISGHWEGIGFLITAKSVFRYGSLKESQDKKLTEYILIGTLLSFGVALAVAISVLGIQEIFLDKI